jgi:hypothetical protein
MCHPREHRRKEPRSSASTTESPTLGAGHPASVVRTPSDAKFSPCSCAGRVHKCNESVMVAGAVPHHVTGWSRAGPEGRERLSDVSAEDAGDVQNQALLCTMACGLSGHTRTARAVGAQSASQPRERMSPAHLGR